MFGLALDDGRLGGAYRGGAALRGDGLSDEIDARLRGRRRCQRSAERERDGRCKNTQHDFLPCDVMQTRWFAMALSRAREQSPRTRPRWAFRLQPTCPI